MDTEPSNQNQSKKGGNRNWLKIFCFFLNLAFLLSCILGGLAWISHKKADKVLYELENSKSSLYLIAKLSKEDRLNAASGDEQAEVTRKLEGEIQNITNSLNVISNPPVHLKSENKFIKSTGYFDGLYPAIADSMNIEWHNALPLLMDHVNLILESINKASKNIPYGQKILEKIYTASFLSLATIALTLFGLIFFYFFNKIASPNSYKADRSKRSSLLDELESDEAELNTNSANIEEMEGEVGRLRLLCESLFDNPYSALCITDHEGDILMENNGFQNLIPHQEEEDSLIELLKRVLPPQQHTAFHKTFQSFFSDDETEEVEELPSLEQYKIAGKKGLYRVSFKPFYTQDEEYCSLITIQEMGA